MIQNWRPELTTRRLQLISVEGCDARVSPLQQTSVTLGRSAQHRIGVFGRAFYNSHWGLSNDHMTCCARKTSPLGKNHESFPLLKIGTGLTRRRETLSNSDQAPGLEIENGPTSHKHEGLPHTNPHRGLPDKISARKGQPQVPLGTAFVHHTVSDSGRPLCWTGLSRHGILQLGGLLPVERTKNGRSSPRIIQFGTQKKCCLSQSASTSVSMNQCVHHDQVMTYCTASSGATPRRQNF